MDRFGFYGRPPNPSPNAPIGGQRQQRMQAHQLPKGLPVSHQMQRIEVVIGSSPSAPRRRPPGVFRQYKEEEEDYGGPIVTSDLNTAAPSPRGRPPRSAMTPCGLTAPQSQSQSPSSSLFAASAAAAADAAAASVASTAASASRGSTANYTVPASTGQVVKKRGRPKGWKPGMPYSTTSKNPKSDAAKSLREQQMRDNPGAYGRRGRPPGAVTASSSGPKAPPRPRGRPPKKPPATAREIFASLQPRFIPFLCEWEGCRAELQNMATLRMHVHRVHGRDEWCRWKGCRAGVRQGPGGDKVGGEGGGERKGKGKGTVSFLTDAALAEHVEKRHLVPFEWHMGDGFRNSTGMEREGDDRGTRGEQDGDGEGGGAEGRPPAYLFDKDGNQVTPWVAHQEEEDYATRLANKKRLRIAMALYDEQAPSEEEDEEKSDEDGS